MPAKRSLAHEEAELAVRKYTRGGIVFVVIRGERNEILGHGSGTLWRSKSGRPIVLTAKHVVAGHRSFTIGSTEGEDVRLRGVSAIEHPTDDIALLELPIGPIAASAFNTGALSDATTLAKGAPILMSGFPEHGTFVDHDSLGEIMRYGDISYFTIAAGSSAEALSINWKEAETSEDMARLFAKAGMKAGRHPMKKPSGISGGAAWLWINPAPNELWSPSKNVRLIGVPHEFANRRQLAVPVWRWREWLMKRLDS